jgi:hypothetical protein
MFGVRQGEAKMKRTNIYLGSSQHKAVVKEAKKLGVSASEVIRCLIDEGLLQRDYDNKWVRNFDAGRVDWLNRKLTRNASVASTAPKVKHGAEDDTHKHLPNCKTT